MEQAVPRLRSMDRWWVRDAPFGPELGELWAAEDVGVGCGDGGSPPKGV